MSSCSTFLAGAMPLSEATLDMIAQLVRYGIPEGYRDASRVVCQQSSTRDAEIRVSWALPDGTQYNVVEVLSGLLSDGQHQQEAIGSLLGHMDQANRQSLEGLASRYGVEQHISPDYAWTIRGHNVMTGAQLGEFLGIGPNITTPLRRDQPILGLIPNGKPKKTEANTRTWADLLLDDGWLAQH